MRITKTKNHGQIRFRVNEPHGADGKRQRMFFPTREAAESYVKERTADSKAYGVQFSTIQPSERAAIVYQLQRLNALGWHLAAAVDFIEKHGKAAPSLPLGTVTDEFLAAKAAAGLRPRYLKTLRASINRFLIGRREKLIADITPAEIQEYISSNGWVPSTMRSYLVDVGTLFGFAVKRKYVRENPVLAVDSPRVEERPPGIVTPAQARRSRRRRPGRLQSVEEEVAAEGCEHASAWEEIAARAEEDAIARPAHPAERWEHETDPAEPAIVTRIHATVAEVPAAAASEDEAGAEAMAATEIQAGGDVLMKLRQF